MTIFTLWRNSPWRNADPDQEPPPKRHCPSAMLHHDPHPNTSSIAVLDRLSNATYHGMANLTYRIFHALSRQTTVDCADVAQKVLVWIHQNDTPHRRKKYTIRPCNRRTGSLQMVYTCLPPDDPIHNSIVSWILQSQREPRTKVTGVISPNNTCNTQHATKPDLSSFDPLLAWGRFQKVFPVMSIYKSQWDATSDISKASSFVWNNESLVGSSNDIHSGMGWPDEIDMMCVIQLAQRLYPEHNWTHWLIRVDGATHCHMESIGCLRRAACVLHGFLLGPNASCTNIWEAISMPSRSVSHPPFD